MVGSQAGPRVYREIVRLAHSGLDARELRLKTMHRLRDAMPIASFWVATADPATLLFTSAVKEAIPDAAIPRFVDNEFLQDDVNKFRVLAAVPGAPVKSLYQATENRPESSRRYREILTPLGFGDELRAAFRTDGSVWGFACLHCERGSRGYTSQHAALFAELGPHLAQGLRNALLLADANRQDSPDYEDRPGLIVLADDLSIAATTPAGERWIAEIGDCAPRSQLPEAVLSVVARLWALEGREREDVRNYALPRTRVQTASGRWVLIHASRLSGPRTVGQTAVMLEPARASEVAPLLLDAYGLTRREGEVAQFILCGIATDGVAAALSISPLTVQQHLKSVFDKTGVGSRRELIARIFAEQYRPMGHRNVP